MFRLKLIFWLVAAALTLEATCVQAKLARTDKQLWFPSVSGLVSRLPSLTAIASHLPSMPSLSSIQTLFSGGGGSSLLAPALADFGSYLSDTMPAFSDVYASIPSWSDWQGLLPNVPRPSTIYNQLPTEVQSGLQSMWAQTNPLNVETFRRRQYQRGTMMMLGLAGFYSNYQGRYKQYRKGIEQYVEPHARKRKYNEMKRVCYYSMPRTKKDNETLAPGEIKPGLCTHLVLNEAIVSAESGSVSISFDETDDGHLQEMIGKLKDAAPKILLCVGGHEPKRYPGLTKRISGSRPEEYFENALQQMAHSKKKRLRFIRSSVGLVRRYGLAGVDISWQPGPSADSNLAHLADLFEEFRAYMEPWDNTAKEEKDKAGPVKDVLLTVTLQGMPWESFHPDNVRRLAKHADWVNIRAFDDYQIGHNSFNKHQRGLPFFQPRAYFPNVAHSVMAWTARGLPHNKIVLGVPLFGRSYAVMSRAGATLGFHGGFDVVGESNLIPHTNMMSDESGAGFLRISDFSSRDPKILRRKHMKFNVEDVAERFSGVHYRQPQGSIWKSNINRRGSGRRTARAVIRTATRKQGATDNFGSVFRQMPHYNFHPFHRQTGTNEPWLKSTVGSANIVHQPAIGKGMEGGLDEQETIIPRMRITPNVQPEYPPEGTTVGLRLPYSTFDVPEWVTKKNTAAIGIEQKAPAIMTTLIKDTIYPYKGAPNPLGMSLVVPMSNVPNAYDKYVPSETRIALNNEKVVHPEGMGSGEVDLIKNAVYSYGRPSVPMDEAKKGLRNMKSVYDQGGLPAAEEHMNNIASMHEGGIMSLPKVSQGTIGVMSDLELGHLGTLKKLQTEVSTNLMDNVMIMKVHAKNPDNSGNKETFQKNPDEATSNDTPADKKEAPIMNIIEMTPSNDGEFDADLNNGFVPYGKICRMVADGGGFQLMRDSTSHTSIASNGIHQILFNDQRDIAAKASWSEDMGLGGIALFSLNEDDWRGKCDPNGTPFLVARTVWKMIG